ELYPFAPLFCPEKNGLTDFLLSPHGPSGLSLMPPVFHLEEPLMDYLSLLLYQTMSERGLTPFRMRLLQAICSGCQNQNALAAHMNTDAKKIWNEKYRLLTQLNIQGHLRELIYGTRFCSFLQRTSFMPPAEADLWRRRTEQRTGSKDTDKTTHLSFPAAHSAG
ncbi:TPA: hypothetical protein R0445_004938, partial [Salmonella enterica subsp. enterica serovar Hvittingfoss]|nr:hypothetical protein [Salmonella enterica subsp. enterica serovar Hvittingfoss]HEB6950287.1 hypothetical protein [Salmonella enterica subsp. enterica serovar Hvittingfoss]